MSEPAISINFTVNSSPMGYTRTTQRGTFDLKYKRYQAYKDLVVQSFLDQVPGDWGHPKPLTTIKGQKTKIEMMIYFKNFKHPDPDNCFKAILDSLFACDKYCTGSFDFSYDSNNPRVEIKIS